MEQPFAHEPFPIPSTFAGLLATLASPPAESVEHSRFPLNGIWNAREQTDNAVTLDHESVVRKHPRYQIADRHANQADSLAGDSSVDAHDLGHSGVTIRLSHAECARLRRRASETGLTVSAYLRSCVLEADSLRAQVKVALGELQRVSSRGKSSGKSNLGRPEPQHSSSWLRRLFPRKQARRLGEK